MNKLQIAAAALVGWNAFVFLLFGVDKRRAVRGGRRIRERTLLLTALFLGAPGAMAGMTLFHHKTRHAKFFLGVPLLLLLNLLLCGALVWGSFSLF